MESLDDLSVNLDFAFNNVDDDPNLLNFSFENIADPAFLRAWPGANLEASTQQNVEAVTLSENQSNGNQRNITEYASPSPPQQPNQVHKGAGFGHNPASQQLTGPATITPFVTTSAFLDSTQLSTTVSLGNTGGAYPPLYRNTAEGLNVGAYATRLPRPLNIMPGTHSKMYCSSRVKKLEEHNSASDVYLLRPPRPQPWGFVDGKGQHQFRYTAQGELDPRIVMTHSEMSEYLYARPFREFTGLRPRWEERQLVEGMRSGLTLWVGWHPPHSRRRQPSADTARCRFRNCPVNNRTIAAGEPRVIFDERFNVMGTKCDPYHNAGYCHLYCLEKYFDILKLFSEIDVRFDTRHFVFEEKNWGGLHNRHHEQPHIAEAWRKREMRKYITHCVSLERRRSQTGRIPRAQAQRPRCFNDSLTRELVTHSILEETNGVKKARITRRRRAKGANRPVPCDIEIHLGNLDFMQQCYDEKRFDKAVSKSRSERDRRLRRTSLTSEVTHPSDSYQPMMFMEGFVPGRSRLTPPPPRRKRQTLRQMDSCITVKQAAYGFESASRAVNNTFLCQGAHSPPHLPYGAPDCNNTNLSTQLVQAYPYSYIQQHIPQPQVYACPPQQSTIMAPPRPASVFGIAKLSPHPHQSWYDEVEQVDSNYKRRRLTQSPSPKRIKLVESNEVGNIQAQRLPRRTSTRADWQTTTSFDLNEWIETVTAVDRGGNRHWFEDAFDYNTNYTAETSQRADLLSSSILPISVTSSENVITHQGELSAPQEHTIVDDQFMNSFIKTPPVPASPTNTILQPIAHARSPVANTDDDPIGVALTAQQPPDERGNETIEPEQIDDGQGALRYQVIPEGETYMLVGVGKPKD